VSVRHLVFLCAFAIDENESCVNAASDEPDVTFEWACSQLRAQCTDSPSEKPKEVAWRTKPSTYVVCSEDQAVHPDSQRIMARRCSETIEWPTGHSPFANRPDRVADLLIGLARRTA